MPEVLIETNVYSKGNKIGIEFVYHMETRGDMKRFLHQLKQSEGGTIRFKGELSGQLRLKGVHKESEDFWGPDGMGEDGAYRW